MRKKSVEAVNIGYNYARKSEYFAKKRDLPIKKNPCPEDRNTEREVMKNRLYALEKELPGLKHRIFHAMCKGQVDGFSLFGRFPDAGEIKED